jgi:hypothetical protein
LDYAQCLNYYGAISIQVPSDFNGVLPAGMDDKTYLERASFVHDYGSDLYKRQLAGQKAAIELERKQRERTLTDVELRNLGSDSMRGLKPVVRPRSGNKPKREDLK